MAKLKVKDITEKEKPVKVTEKIILEKIIQEYGTGRRKNGLVMNLSNQNGT